MNFFKSVFSSDPDPSDSSSDEKSPSDSPHKPQEDEKGKNETTAVTGDDSEPDDYSNPKTNTPWVGLGSLIKTFAAKSESVIQTYRRDLEEFGSGLKKETASIREVATRAVLDLPSSLEVGASVAQESLESVGQAIDDFGGSVWRGTAEIISEGKDAFLAVDSDAETPTHSSDLQTAASTGLTASASKRYSRFDAQVLAMQSDPSTFSEGPEDAEDFLNWMSEFKLKGKEEEIETLCYDSGTLEDLFEKLVPSVVDYDTFWTRYFYKLYKLRQAEEVRANLVKRAISREDEEEDLTWEVDDDAEEEKEEEVEKDVEGERNDEIKEEDEAKTVNKEQSQVESVEERKEKIDINAIESVHEKKSDGVPEDLSLKVSAAIDTEIEASSVGAADDTEPANNRLTTTNLGDKVLPDAKPEPVESCKDSDISIVSSQTSMPEEEDLGWDEIEDLGEHDNATTDKVDLHKRLSVLEQDEDLTWDIEDDD